MFANSKKPLPQQSNRVAQMQKGSSESPKGQITTTNKGILLGGDVFYNPEMLPNPHIVAIGASGSGKTQTLKALAHDICKTYPQIQVVVIDFHGDQAILNEKAYPLHMSSPHGINPLTINLDNEGGGPSLQAISTVSTLKKALGLGPNQEGFMLELLKTCYLDRGILQNDPKTWTTEPPHFGDVQEAISALVEDGDNDAKKLQLKLAATFQYGIFSRVQPPFQEKLVRLDLCKLPPALQSIAAESLAKQLMDKHRLMGEIQGRIPRTYLFIDEAKEMPRMSGNSCDRIIADGRKYGLGLIMASQSERHLSKDVIGNSSTKIVLPVDATEAKKVAQKFRFAESKIAGLHPLEALIRLGKDGYAASITPYWQRVVSQ